MVVVNVFVGEKLIATYPDCFISSPDNSLFWFVVPTGTQDDLEATKEARLCSFPKSCSSVSVISMQQEEK